MSYHYVWLMWSNAFLLPWIALYLSTPLMRPVMWRASLGTALLGLTEPLFVPEYWDPPGLFHLAQRTGFDIESVIFTFAIGGVGAVFYNALTRTHLAPLARGQTSQTLHRFHWIALLLPYATFVPLVFLPWNPIYPGIVALLIGSATSVLCRPHLAKKTLIGGALFLGLYAVFMVGLTWLAPGYVAQVWNLPALSGVLLYGIPLEELLFGTAFGMYWGGVYEHFTRTESVVHVQTPIGVARQAQ